MDGSVAIERNRVALVRIVASLVAMAGLAVGDEPRAEGGARRTLPRHLWLAIMRLLRPAEAAARRLIIAAARGLVVPPVPRKPKPKPADPAPLLRRLGLAVMASPADNARAAAEARKARADRARAGRILPCEAGEGDHAQRGGGGVFKPHVPAFALLDPLRDPLRALKRRRYVPDHAAPRIMFPGVTQPHRLPPPPPPPSPDDPISAVRLAQRLAALAAALDDLPGQARRFARWKARLDAGLAGRTTPLRGGPPPGGRLKRYDPEARRPRKIREIDEILAHAHDLALYALECPDTS